ncbi:YicC family protein [Aliigemmobacter aestuarii]|uniref:YicC family protein n=1 Tax=Aliigemmobacter aestuarii TaxID=1445661 RepID=A0A4S3MQ89_9RHOB|nr:YicC/YloC family endoribonuclease [Gemmobacter aestuarii]THD84234.1 YicC family protein [Gemmobacter aestuarii]
MTQSMTGFAARKGQGEGHAWVWDIRSVNGKGLDLRLRLPDWIEGLEAAIRAELQKALNRGNVSLTLKVARDAGGAEALRLNGAALHAALLALREVQVAAEAAGVAHSAPSPAEILSLRGVLETGGADEDAAPLRAALLADLAPLLADFTAMRAAEGAALNRVIGAQLDQIAALRDEATRAAAARADQAAQALRDNLARVLANAEGIDETRLAQELALIAVKNDITEELDRLAAHVDAARALLREKGPVGRKFDFLMQEFMREANTLCSKAQSLDLTRIGLDLKTVIDQMREQVQNVE